VQLEIEPVEFRCRVCAHEYRKADAAGDLSADDWEAIHFVPELAKSYLRCPKCKSPDFEVTAGRGVQIDSIEGE
jgi:hydrogenase nickel incorporation protein HypA/HybF